LPIVAMNRKEKENYLSALLYRGEWEYAVQLYRNHPYLTIEKELLSPFAEALMEREEKDLALYLAHLAFRKASLSDRGLSYLLEEWDGGSKEMYAILKKGEERREEKGKVDSAQLLNMAERLLAQCLFTDKIREAQEAFTLYRKFSGRETLLLRAFLTAYAAAIFLYQKRESKEFTELLYEEVRGETHKERVPVLYLLALSFSFSPREGGSGGNYAAPSGKESCFFLYEKTFPFSVPSGGDSGENGGGVPWKSGREAVFFCPYTGRRVFSSGRVTA